MKIKSITIEGLHNVAEKTYTFGDLSYLYGRNGAGKSTALQAVQLALLGYIPGVDKKNEAILRHAKNKTLSVTCVLDNNGQDVTISRSWVSTGKTVTKGMSVTPEGFDIESILADIELPIYNFSEFMNMTANKMKDWFINFLPNEAAEVDWNKELTSALGDMKVIDDTLLCSTLAHIKELPEEGAELVRAANTYLKDYTSYLKGNLQKTQNTIQSLIHYDDCDEVPNMEAMQAEIDKLNEYLIKAAKIESVKEMNRRINEQIALIHVSGTSVEDDTEYAEIQKSVKETSEMVMKYEADMQDIMAKKAELDAKVAELNADIKSKTAVTSGKGMCPYTKAECNSIKELIAEIDEEIRQDTIQINEYSNELAKLASSYKNSSLALQSAKATLESKLNKAGAIAADYKELSRLRSQLQMEELIEGQEMSSEEVRSKISELQDKLAKAAANATYNQLIDTLTADKFKIENSIEVIKIWTKLTDANGLQSTIMEKPFKELASKMDSYLHKMFNRKDINTHFNLSEKANSFSFGLVRDEKYIEFDMLSSGEKCLYTLALMMCLVASSKSPLKVVMIDDLLDHLDDMNAGKLFDALYKVKDIQFILAGVKLCDSKCSNEVVIEVGGK